MHVPARPPPLYVLASLGAVLTGCSTDGRSIFDAEVVPILERSCAASTCHGVPPDAEARGEVIDRDRFFVDTDGRALTDLDAAYAASLERIDAADLPVNSTLIRKPLAAAFGGLPHAGGENLLSLRDPDVEALLRWIDAEPQGGEDPEPLDALEQLFADEVQPVLLAMGCATAGCHGLDASIPFRLDAGPGQLGVAATRHNAEVVRSMASPSSDPLQSRFVAKALPLHAGGILHKGGNDRFLSGPDDPRLDGLERWICAVREADTGAGCGGEPTGLIYVRGPRAPEGAFDLDVFAPGSDLWLAPVLGPDLQLGPPTNLTAALHDGPADLRDPALDPSGQHLLFSMRLSVEEGHALWHMDLDSGEAEQLTWPESGSDRDPSWGRHGTIWFASTRANTVAADGVHLDAELYELDDGAVSRRSWTPQVERTPRYLATGDENGGEVAFTVLRDAQPEQAVGHPFRFPPDLATEYHQHFGATGPTSLLFDMQELPDGRYPLIASDLRAVWPLGGLAILDRNFGPALVDDSPPAMPAYAEPLRVVAPTDGGPLLWPEAWGDPTPLPDGRIVAARTDGPLDTLDPDGAPHTHLAVARLGQHRDGLGAVLEEAWTLLDDPDLSLWDPLPVLVRAPGPPAGAPPEPEEPGRARFLHQGLPLIDGILAQLPPSGVRAPFEGFVGARVVEALRASPAQRRPVPAGQTLHGRTGTTLGLTRHSPARVLAELPLEDDGTFQIDMPAETAIRIQGLDERGFAAGTPHNRWYDIAPGQTIKQGVDDLRDGVYGTRCAGCHGAQDGVPEHTFAEPDVLTTATFTLARFEGGDPRRPIPPTRVGDDTAIEVDFRRDVEPLLAPCVPCHDADPLDLRPEPTTHYTVAYENLLMPGKGSGRFEYVDGTRARARTSFLIEVLVNEELDALRTLDGVPPHEPLPADSLAALVRWIDLGAHFIGHPEDAP